MGMPFELSLSIHNEEIQSVFEILGTKENDLSYSLGYALSKSPRLLKAIIKEVYKTIRFSNAVIKLQEYGKDSGFTDFEIIIDNEYLFVIEAKIGWNLPTKVQLKRYLPRFREFKKTKRMFIILSDCKKEYFRENYSDSLYGIPVRSLSWANIIELINKSINPRTNKEKFFLKELVKYLKEVVIMENQESSWVYVVSLAKGTPSWSTLSWRDVVYKKGHYFYPQQKNWPKIPPNYIAFRFDGKLQSIHHVEKYEVVQDVHKYIPEIRKGRLQNYYLLWLGKEFEPRKETPNGNIWSSGRFRCLIDTLFTSKTIEEAIRISKKRLS